MSRVHSRDFTFVGNWLWRYNTSLGAVQKHFILVRREFSCVQQREFVCKWICRFLYFPKFHWIRYHPPRPPTLAMPMIIEITQRGVPAINSKFPHIGGGGDERQGLRPGDKSMHLQLWYFLFVSLGHPGHFMVMFGLNLQIQLRRDSCDSYSTVAITGLISGCVRIPGCTPFPCKYAHTCIYICIRSCGRDYTPTHADTHT